MVERSPPVQVGQPSPAAGVGSDRLTQRIELPVWLVPVLGIAFAGGYGIVLTYAMTRYGPDVWVGLVVAPLLVVVTVPLLMRVARGHVDSTLVLLLVGALLFKLAASLVRWYVGMEVYDGGLDAVAYLDHGERLAELYRTGQFAIEDLQKPLIGTGFVRGLSGLVQTLVASSTYATFLIFSWMGFLGLVAFVAAFATAIPEGLTRRYAVLVLFVPSLLYWPSSVGKDAWMLLTLGLGAYGAAKVLGRRRGGYAVLMLGLAGASMVRPHMALLLVVAVTIAYALRRPPPEHRPLFGPLGKAVGVGVLTVASVVVLGEVEEYFGVETDPSGAETVFEETERRTTKGGSSFEAQQVESPLDLPEAAVTVLFRPFPWEGNNMQARLAGLEGVFLLALMVAGWQRLRGIPRLVRRTPWVAMATVYVAMFVVAFSSMGNFGVLARQRVQVLPFFLALLCLPLIRRQRGDREVSNWAGSTSRRREVDA